MLYLLVTQLGWLAFTILLIVVVALYTKIKREITYLRRDVTNLQAELEQQKNRSMNASSTHLADERVYTRASASEGNTTKNDAAKHAIFDSQQRSIDNLSTLSFTSLPPPLPVTTPTPTKNKIANAPIEPDERSLPIVTSLIHSIKNWFFSPGKTEITCSREFIFVSISLLLFLTVREKRALFLSEAVKPSKESTAAISPSLMMMTLWHICVISGRMCELRIMV